MAVPKNEPRIFKMKQAKPSVFNAARHLGGLVPKFGSLLVGITAIAYFAGWRNVSTYYETLGASWVLSTLPSITFLSVSAELIVTILITTFMVVLMAEEHEVSPTLLSLAVIGLAVAAVVVARILPSILPAVWLSEKTKWILIQLGSGLMAASAGTILAQLSVRLSNSKNKWSSNMAFSLYTALLVGLWGVPSQVGQARAEHDLNIATTSFPLVEIANSTSSVPTEWRLIEVIGSNALLVALSNKAGTHTFRLVQVQDLTIIHFKKRGEHS